MPYKKSSKLPAEKASKIGHLKVIESELTNKLLEEFVSPKFIAQESPAIWTRFDVEDDSLPIVFGIDGSIQTITGDTQPQKELSFVKTALLRLDEYALSRIDKESPHPFALRDIMAESAIYHSTVFPLKHVTLENMNTYDTVRQIIFESMKDQSFEGQIFDTLKWIAYEKWKYDASGDESDKKRLPPFQCPHCADNRATLEYDADSGPCPNCGKEIFVTDFLGFHLDMIEDSARQAVALAYMNIHEVLFMFSGIRYFWINNRKLLKQCLFVKDGPLSIRAQYSKLVAPIRRFLAYANEIGIPIHIIGQEKTGTFVEHLELISRDAPHQAIFVPDDTYIKQKIQQRESSYPYGRDTNYGAKVYISTNSYHKMVLNIPTKSSQFLTEPTIDDLIGIGSILDTLPRILSNRFEGALLPIELAHGIASLSTYPSAQILKIFAGI